MARLLSMMREGEGATTSFPRHVLICDSCPGYFHWQRVHAALAQALPRWTSPFIHLGIAINWLLFAPLGYEPPPDLQARELNGKELAGVQTRRLYLYGTGDDMVDWRDVEDHAARAEEVGVDVRREVFPGSRHVAHVRVDGERYWRAVEETWEGEGRG